MDNEMPQRASSIFGQSYTGKLVGLSNLLGEEKLKSLEKIFEDLL